MSFNELKSFSNITGLGSYTFSNCYALKYVDLENITSIGSYSLMNSGVEKLDMSNVTNIADRVMAGCSKLKSVILSKNIISIGVFSFSSCVSLYSISNFEYIKTIPDRLMDSCKSLLHLKIGDAVYIGDYSFAGCSSLIDVTISAETPPELKAIYSFNWTNNCPIYVPDNSVETYKTATNWSAYASRIKPISEFTE